MALHLRRRLNLQSSVSLAILCAFVACAETASIERSSPTSPSLPPQSDVALTQSYSSAQFGFVVDYPADLVVLPEPSARAETRPPRLFRVRFQDVNVANSPFADLDPPKFTIEVFDAPGKSLGDWLQSYDRMRPGSSVQSFTVQGAREALHVSDMRLLAPNEFYYVRTDRFVFALTPLGAAGNAIVSSFRVTAQ